MLRWATVREQSGPKVAAAVPLSMGSYESSSNTMSPGPRLYLRTKWNLDPSNRLATIHQRYRQDRQRSDSIRRTVLQTVAQKPSSFILLYIQTVAISFVSLLGVDYFLWSESSSLSIVCVCLCIRIYVCSDDNVRTNGTLT